MDRLVRVTRLGVVGTVISMSLLGGVSPASAGEANDIPMPCEAELEALGAYPDPLASGIVTQPAPGQIQVHPSAVAPYATAVVSHYASALPAYALCMKERYDGPVDNAVAAARCAANYVASMQMDPLNLNFRYVSIDRGTGAVTLNYGQLLADEYYIQTQCLGIVTIN